MFANSPSPTYPLLPRHSSRPSSSSMVIGRQEGSNEEQTNNIDESTQRDSVDSSPPPPQLAIKVTDKSGEDGNAACHFFQFHARVPDVNGGRHRHNETLRSE